MHKVFTYGPLRGPFSLLAAAVAGCILAFLGGRVVVRYQFMGVLGSANMTWQKFGASFFGASLAVHFFMVGAGEGGMTCAPVGNRRPRTPAGCPIAPDGEANVGLRCGPIVLAALLHGSRIFSLIAVHDCRRSRLHDTADFGRDEPKRKTAAWLVFHACSLPACWMTA